MRRRSMPLLPNFLRRVSMSCGCRAPPSAIAFRAFVPNGAKPLMRRRVAAAGEGGGLLGGLPRARGGGGAMNWAAAGAGAGRTATAAGAWADEVAAACGVAPVGIQPYRRTVMQV